MSFLGLDIGGTDIKWAVFSSKYEILARGNTPTPQSSLEDLMAALAPIVTRGDFTGVGVSVPGSIPEALNGVVLRGGHLTYLDNVPLGRLLGQLCPAPVFIENDGKCCALGEYAFGALKGVHIGVVLAIGTGIGGGIIIDGRILKGIHAFAGEFSFLITDRDKGLSSETIFGRSGGWRSGLMQRVIKAKALSCDTELNGIEIFALINSGDPAALEALEDYAQSFAVHVLNLQTTLDPDVIALGGGIGAEPALLRSIRRGIDRLVGGNPLNMPLPNIVHAATGKDANLLGAVYGLRCHLSKLTKTQELGL